ncbi:MAG: putative toxin-antitoxin system toxin component, PIN family [Verrucomicrobiales bacterium]|nr:putative toxin-antitoxin system toxin component, PIN family [Verrucomicrobiales bacterium]
MRVVFDAKVVVAGVCWQGDGWLCLIRMARRQAFAYGTVATLEETRETAVRVIRERQPTHNASARLDWYLDNVRRVEPSPLGKRRSRDERDDPYLAAALAGKAQVLVTYDHDRLDLGKPFGIPIVRPARFLAMFHPG